jgi:Tfp pilus assembly protein PilV
MTIAEVMITAVVLGIVIISSLGALQQAYAFTHHARQVTLAGQVVQSVMEDLRLRNFSEIQTYAAQTQPVDFTSILTTERFASAFTTNFTVAGNFTTVVASNPPQYGKINVTMTVNWTERGSRFSRSLMTVFSEKGLSDYYYVGWAP